VFVAETGHFAVKVNLQSGPKSAWILWFSLIQFLVVERIIRDLVKVQLTEE
jgi:hypothetical protein